MTYVPPYNGVEEISISATLERMPKVELEQLLGNAEEIKRIAKNSSEVKRSIAMKESHMQENRRVAEYNLSLEPQFLAQKQQLNDVYDRLEKAREEYGRLKAQLDTLASNYAPSTILALMQTANAEAEEASEKLAEQFISRTISVDDFLKEFIVLRKLCNERRFKSEKLAEMLSHGQPMLPTRPAAFSPIANAEPSPAVQTNLSNPPLYPHLGGTFSAPSNEARRNV